MADNDQEITEAEDVAAPTEGRDVSEQKKKNWTVLALILGFVALLWVVTMLKMMSGMSQ